MGEAAQVGEMLAQGPEQSRLETLIERGTMCLPDYTTCSVAPAGENAFSGGLQEYVSSTESNALERLVQLKFELRRASTSEFWRILLRELCEITGAQYGFVTKRILVDDDKISVELADHSERGPCLVGIATYVCNDNGTPETGYQYHSGGTPCFCMRHNKVCIVPERFSELCPESLKMFAGKHCEAFIGMPLFRDGNCFANFGIVWDSEGAKRRGLRWPFIELLLHSLEDIVVLRMLEGREFSKEEALLEAASAMPISAVTPPQSLKPYAQSLSHELRTPMQGVVGMLDIMYATVLDAIANQRSDRVRAVFSDLKHHIEIVQDSSKRAVEAADNVVHACDLNMQMPETPLTPTEPGGQSPSIPALSSSQIRCSSESLSTSTSMLTSSNKRSFERGTDPDFQLGPPSKRMFKMTETEIANKYYHVSSRSSSISAPSTKTAEVFTSRDTSGHQFRTEANMSSENIASVNVPCVTSPTHRCVFTREFMRNLVNIALRTAHPTSEVHTQTRLGEAIEFQNLGARGEMQKRMVHLQIEQDVPEVIVTDVQNLEFPIQKVIDNAIKFTESGSITITVQLGVQLQVVDIWVSDTGRGISEKSKRSLFTPHFQEDASISRTRDGLGLSLFNAKAHVRMALGGDVTLERSVTEGPSKGSEFLIRLPISSTEAGSTDPPFVGLLPPLRQQCCRSGRLHNHVLSATAAHPTRGFPITPTTETSPNSTPRKQVAFNRHLAEDYPLNILIAEDNATNREVAMGLLSKLGYAKDRITVAFDGLEAVQLYAASLAKPPEQRFDVILMDIWMPNMDGFEATARILDLAREEGLMPKIIAVTADITGGCVDQAKASGMQGFLAKPYKVLDIEHLVLQHFGKL